jgi:hypothetical protein
LYGQVGRFLAFQDAINVGRSSALLLDRIECI